MEMQIRHHNVEVTGVLRAHVERRLGFALRRFAERIARVVVRFSDANGHRGGVIRRCQIDVDLYPSDRVSVAETDANVFVATDCAAGRASRSIARALERSARPQPTRRARRRTR